MKSLLLALALVTFSSVGFSADKVEGDKKAAQPMRKVAAADIKCSDKEDMPMDADYIIKQIEGASSCYMANQISEACGFGSAIDTQIAGAAEGRCEKDMGRLSASDKDLENRMVRRCATACNPKTDGTLCLSQQAFCRLKAVTFIFNVQRKNN